MINLALARPSGFLHRPSTYALRRFAPYWARASWKKNKHIGRCDTQQLTPKLKVLSQPVTSEVMSMDQKSRFGCWLTILPKMAAYSQNSGTIVIISWNRVEWSAFCLVTKDKSQGWLWDQGEVKPLRSLFEPGRSSFGQSVDSVAQWYHNGDFLDSIGTYLNFIESSSRKTLMTKDNLCDVICDVTQSNLQK